MSLKLKIITENDFYQLNGAVARSHIPVFGIINKAAWNFSKCDSMQPMAMCALGIMPGETCGFDSFNAFPPSTQWMLAKAD